MDPNWPYNEIDPPIERPTLHSISWMGDFIVGVVAIVIAIGFIVNWLRGIL